MPAPEQNLVCVTLKAAADLSTKQFYFCKVNSSGKAALCDTAGESAYGVIYNKPSAADQATQIAVGGIVKCVASASIAAGALVAVTSAGKAKAAVTGKTDTSDAGASADALIGSYVVGTAITAAAADGDVFALHLRPMGAVPTTAA